MTLRNVFCFSSVLLTTVGAAVLHAQTNSLMTNVPPVAPWVSSAALGLTLTRGNSDTTTLSANANTEKKWDVNDLAFGADGLYATEKIHGANKSSETADLLHGFGQYNRSFTTNFYGYFRLDGLHDGIADIQYRLTISPGMGYYFVKEKDTQVSVEAGPSWIDEKLGNTYLNYAALRFAEKIQQTISDRSRFWQTLEYFPQVDNFNNWIANLEIGLEADLTARKNLSLRVTFDDTYNNVPAPGRLKNDLKVITAIAYKF